jgi:hypothetical protein
MNGMTDRQTDMVKNIEEFVQLCECDECFGPFFTLWSILCKLFMVVSVFLCDR